MNHLCKQFDVIKVERNFMVESIMGVVRSTFVISPSGDILKHWDKVKVAGHAEEVLEFVKGAMNYNVDHEEVEKFAVLSSKMVGQGALNLNHYMT